ncbi:MAG: putative lipid II flippase FtsW [Candidatus Omnitrophota bacterium]|jgi:cell division protein FtsW
MRDIRSSIFIIVMVLVAIGIIMIYSASAIYAYEKMGDSLYFLKRHLLYLLLGLVMMFMTMAVNLSTLKKYAKPLMIFSAFLLIAVLIPHIGRETGGARRWFRLGPVNFQPTELTKLAMIIYMADLLARKKDEVRSFLHGFMPPVMVLGFTVCLILLEPDLGTAVAISLITIIMLFVAGVRVSHLAASLLASIPALYVLVFSVAYRRRRILAFLNPWADRRGTGFQIIQSFVALGSGGIFGVGLGQSKQKLFYLPASHTDFIFSIIGEELGFLGTAAIVTLFALFLWQGMKVVFKSEGLFEKYMSMGIVSLITLEAVINIGVTAGALPTKGLPLPFISYGGSGLIFHLAAVGLLLNAAKTCEVHR